MIKNIIKQKGYFQNELEGYLNKNLKIREDVQSFLNKARFRIYY
jgi:hypothetical protein